MPGGSVRAAALAWLVMLAAGCSGIANPTPATPPPTDTGPVGFEKLALRLISAPQCPRTLELSLQFASSYGGQKLVVDVTGDGSPAEFTQTIPKDGSPIVHDWPVETPGNWAVSKMTVGGKPVSLPPNATAVDGSLCFAMKDVKMSPGPPPSCANTLTVVLQFAFALPGGTFTANLSGPGVAPFSGAIPPDGSPTTKTFPITGPGTWTLDSIVVGKGTLRQGAQAAIQGCR